jgi:hypothetical protein
MEKYNYYSDFDKFYTLVEVKPSKIKLKKQIINIACGSIYRMNAGGADCYAFSYDVIGQKYRDGTTCKKVDFSGGWDWSKHIVHQAMQFIYKFDDNKFYEVIDIKNS